MSTSYPVGAARVNAPAVSAATPAPDPLTPILGEHRTIAYHPEFSHACGSTDAGILLSQLWFWSNTPTAQGRAGWFYLSQNQISQQTGLSHEQTNSARTRLRDLGIIKEVLMGNPATLHYYVDHEALFALLREYSAELAAQLASAQAEVERRAACAAQKAGKPYIGKLAKPIAGFPQTVVGYFRKWARRKATIKATAEQHTITEIPSPIPLDISSEVRSMPKGEEAEAEAVVPLPAPLSHLAAAWETAKTIIAEAVNKPTFETHIRPLSLENLSESGEAILRVGSHFSREWLEKRHAENLRSALGEVFGRDITLRFNVVPVKPVMPAKGAAVHV